MTLKPYPLYRDSTVDWLGDIPNHWEVHRLRTLAALAASNVDKVRVDGEAEVRLCNYTDVYHHHRITNDMRFMVATASEDELAHFALRIGDVLFTKDSESFTDIGIPAVVNEDLDKVVLGYHLMLARPNHDVHGPYLAWFFTPQRHRWQFEVSAKGVTRFGMPLAGFKNAVVPLPFPEEQRAIADFLDAIDARITRFIAARRKMLQLLEEKKQAVIGQAVTKGLDPDVPLKDSGVDWLGAIPAHWEVRRLVQVARLESGHTPSRQRPDYWENCTIPWVSLKDVGKLRDGRSIYIDDTYEKVSELGIANSSARLLPAETVILSRTASVGYSAILRVPMATTQDFVNWICGPALRPHFLLKVLRGMRSHFEEIMIGSTHKTIYMPDVRAFTIPVPPICEQQKIVEFLDSELARLESLMDRYKEEIALMQEFRTRLISDVVTGKLDVRGVELPDLPIFGEIPDDDAILGAPVDQTDEDALEGEDKE